MKKWFIVGGIVAAVGAAFAIFKMRQRKMVQHEEMKEVRERETQRVL